MPTSHTGATWVTVMQGRLPIRSVHCCRLKVIRGPDKGREARIEKSHFRVGALPSNDLVLTDRAVSGHHFEVRLEGEGYRLRDLGSSNGTVVSDLRIHDVYLSSKARIEVGDTRLQFEVMDDSVEVAASGSEKFGPLLGRSVVMREMFAQLENAARSDATILITGETGTGKELVAEAVLAASDRADKPMVVVDCGALAPTLVESELFGHEKGAFTGATASVAGAFERADGGTVFLDEIGELPLSLQPKLLRVLENREVRRVGSGTTRTVDIRVLAATHRALEEEVNRGSFRADLFYRLSVVAIRVPPLRERLDDVPLLATQFLSQIPDADPALLTDEVLAQLGTHSWPGNVRELRNAIERLAVGVVPVTASSVSPGPGAGAEGTLDLQTPFRVQKERLIDRFERQYARALLEYSPDNLARAARKAGLDRMAVLKLLQRHGLLDR